jgi:hypothetical protein
MGRLSAKRVRNSAALDRAEKIKRLIYHQRLKTKIANKISVSCFVMLQG